MYPNIIAVNVKCRGRHTRNERASRNWFKKGAVDSGNIKARVDYASAGVVLKYGYTNVKVWFLKWNDNHDI
jgi:ribosomal protein S3